MPAPRETAPRPQTLFEQRKPDSPRVFRPGRRRAAAPPGDPVKTSNYKLTLNQRLSQIQPNTLSHPPKNLPHRPRLQSGSYSSSFVSSRGPFSSVLVGAGYRRQSDSNRSLFIFETLSITYKNQTSKSHSSSVTLKTDDSACATTRGDTTNKSDLAQPPFCARSCMLTSDLDWLRFAKSSISTPGAAAPIPLQPLRKSEYHLPTSSNSLHQLASPTFASKTDLGILQKLK
jgi:hypothetical protein